MIDSLPDHCFHTPAPGALKASPGGTPPRPRRRIFRMIMRFLNIVEPGPEVVLSWTRIGFIAVLFVLVHVAIFSPTNIVALVGALAAAAPLVINYIHQRITDTEVGGNPNSTDVKVAP